MQDENGPILSFTADPPGHGFESFSRVGQDVIHDHRGEFRLNYVFEGDGLAGPDIFSLTLHDHAFFRGLDIAGDSPPRHDQFALRPGSKATIAFYGPNEDDAELG